MTVLEEGETQPIPQEMCSDATSVVCGYIGSHPGDHQGEPVPGSHMGELVLQS